MPRIIDINEESHCRGRAARNFRLVRIKRNGGMSLQNLKTRAEAVISHDEFAKTRARASARWQLGQKRERDSANEDMSKCLKSSM